MQLQLRRTTERVRYSRPDRCRDTGFPETNGEIFDGKRFSRSKVRDSPAFGFTDEN
jgi:hypothetical protein